MKKLLACLLVLACLFSFALAEGEKLALSDVNSDNSYRIKLTRKITLSPPSETPYRYYHVQQGACTDGTYAYMIMENQNDSLGSIWKVDLSTWEVADVAYGLDIDHGNCLTYNSRRNQLVVIHNKPHYNTLSFIDPETLQPVEKVRLSFNMYCIAYDEVSDRYAIGISGSYDFVITDNEFNILSLVHGKDTGLVKQGMDCDDKYIYLPQNSSDETINRIYVYDWDGNFVNFIVVSSFQEIEDMFHVGDTTYIAFNASGSYVYEANLSIMQ